MKTNIEVRSPDWSSVVGTSDASLVPQEVFARIRGPLVSVGLSAPLVPTALAFEKHLVSYAPGQQLPEWELWNAVSIDLPPIHEGLAHDEVRLAVERALPGIVAVFVFTYEEHFEMGSYKSTSHAKPPSMSDKRRFRIIAT